MLTTANVNVSQNESIIASLEFAFGHWNMKMVYLATALLQRSFIVAELITRLTEVMKELLGMHKKDCLSTCEQ